ncbi:MAG: DUF4231 domain-containing protein [Anaerolineaceae bacterium]|nr:DUF4231 domain-containing protein [Anaerolineaceae bacterium]
MAQEPPSPDTGKTAAPDPALVSAWQRLLDYDRISSGQKSSYQTTRSWIIVLGLFTTAFAVFNTYIPVLESIFRIALIIMPIATVLLMNYASQFAGSTVWLQHRASAEIIRSQIYRYRVRVGDYQGKSQRERQYILLNSIQDINRQVTNQESPPHTQIPAEEVVVTVTQKTNAPAEDDGFSDMTVENYIAWRVRPQLDWYTKKIQNDYRNMRRERVWSLVVSGAGSVLAAMGETFAALVAVTTAMGIALNRRAELRMYGATYSIYQWAANQLQEELEEWNILPDSEKTEDTITEFVLRIESVFSEEREMWRDQATQIQMSSEQAIFSNQGASGGAVQSVRVRKYDGGVG